MVLPVKFLEISKFATDRSAFFQRSLRKQAYLKALKEDEEEEIMSWKLLGNLLNKKSSHTKQ